MGSCVSNLKECKEDDVACIDTGEVYSVYPYPLARLDDVHHYMPANLPLNPRYAPAYVAICRKSWNSILAAESPRMASYGKNGIVLFYDEFFFRLFQRDASFKDVFPDIQWRADVLMKAMSLMLNSPASNLERWQHRLRYLGRRHQSFVKVRPHHFATYVSTIGKFLYYTF